jgi:hypothetical protein
VAFLPAETLDFGDGEPGDADFGKCLAHLVELEGFDDGFDLFHGQVSLAIKKRRGSGW